MKQILLVLLMSYGSYALADTEQQTQNAPILPGILYPNNNGTTINYNQEGYVGVGGVNANGVDAHRFHGNRGLNGRHGARGEQHRGNAGHHEQHRNHGGGHRR